MGFLADGDMLVVETDDELFLGTVECQADTLILRSGFVGRPVVVDVEKVIRITHPDEWHGDHP